MKIAAVFCIYNEEAYIEYAVRAILPAVERIFILLGKVPYDAYNPNARTFSKPDRTQRKIQELAAQEPKIRLVAGIWSNEVQHRNAGLALCLEEGIDYYWLVDGDEVYRQDHWKHIRQEIEQRPEVGTFIVKCHIFWRSFGYRIPAQELAWRPRRIFKLTRQRRILGLRLPHRIRFTGQNETNSIGPVYEFPPDRAVFYHFSYARTNQAMVDKFKTFSHAHEISDDWIERVWKGWPRNRSMRNIHPVDPAKYPRAAACEPSDLPEIMRSHPYYGLDVIE